MRWARNQKFRRAVIGEVYYLLPTMARAFGVPLGCDANPAISLNSRILTEASVQTVGDPLPVVGDES